MKRFLNMLCCVKSSVLQVHRGHVCLDKLITKDAISDYPLFGAVRICLIVWLGFVRIRCQDLSDFIRRVIASLLCSNRRCPIISQETTALNKVIRLSDCRLIVVAPFEMINFLLNLFLLQMKIPNESK